MDILLPSFMPGSSFLPVLLSAQQIECEMESQKVQLMKTDCWTDSRTVHEIFRIITKIYCLLQYLLPLYEIK